MNDGQDNLEILARIQEKIAYTRQQMIHRSNALREASGYRYPAPDPRLQSSLYVADLCASEVGRTVRDILKEVVKLL